VHKLTVDPFPTLQFIYARSRDITAPALHSLFEITTAERSVWMFDASWRQFKWDPDAWFTSESYFSTHHTKSKERRYPIGPTRAETPGAEGIYWKIVTQLVKELIQKLDWKVLSNMGSGQREGYVKGLAEAKFAKAFELAEAIYGERGQEMETD